MKESVQAKLMLSAAMVIFGTLGVFTRNIGVTSGELALYRAVLASVLIGVYLVFIKKGGLNLKNAGRELPLLLASGIAMGINWILLFQAYRYTTISAATLSYYFAPVIVTVASPLLFHERLTAKQIICFVMSTLGLAPAAVKKLPVLQVFCLGWGRRFFMPLLFCLINLLKTWQAYSVPFCRCWLPLLLCCRTWR